MNSSALSRPRTTSWILAFLLLLSAGLRFYGNHWGLPNRERFTTLYIDEYTPLHWLSRMDVKKLDFNPRDFREPTFYYYQVGAALQLASWTGRVHLSKDQGAYLDHPEEYAKLYYIGRGLTALYGIALTALLFFIGRRIGGSDLHGLLAAGFYAVTPLAVLSAHVLDLGVPVAFWLGLTFFFLIKALQDRRLADLRIAALIAGLSLSTKYTAAPIAFTLLYALWHLKAAPKEWIVVPLLSLGGFVIGTPYLLFELPLFFKDMHDAVGNHVVNAPRTLEQFLMPLRQYSFAVGSLLTCVCLIGLVRQLKERRPAATAALLYLVPYLFLLGKSEFNVTRYLNETLPFLLPFAGLAFAAIQGSRRSRRIMQAVVLLLCLSEVPYTFAINRSLANQVDPRDEASAWIRAHIPAGAVVGLPTEANFMYPGHLYMQYWKGTRYPKEKVRSPDYRIVVWDPVNKTWPDRSMRFWVQHNLQSGLGFKNPDYVAGLRRSAEEQRAGFHPIAVFHRSLRWGPFHYDLPASPGYDWIIFFPTITVYAKNL
jgi:hypothetical protein